MGTVEYLQRPGGRIAYEVAGSGPLVIAVPGMGDLRSVYRYLTPPLVAAGYRVVIADLRGHGDSDATFDSYDDVANGGDLVALVRHLGPPAVLIGNSMGAGVATWAAAEAPELVSGLVLLGPFVRNPPARRGAMLAFRLALLKPWGPATWIAYYGSHYKGHRPPDLKRHQEHLRANLRQSGHWRAFAATTHTTHAPVEARLAEVRAPTLVVMGDQDRDFPDPSAEARFIADHLVAEVVMVPGAGHYPQAQFPEVVAPAVLDFLDRAAGLAEWRDQRLKALAG
jgi:pimeloyl-ACP methyl ester carboxylesterase